jgi:HAD superfamily phosphoserine phosphatase-like hydrolase
LLGQRLYALAVLPRLNPLALAEMKKRRAAGYQIIVLSGAFDFMLQPFCDAYDINNWQCTRLAFADDLCQGTLEGPEFLGEEKVRYLTERFAANRVDWEASCAYSDEIRDVPVLSLVGNPFLLADAMKSATDLPSKFQVVDW